MGRKFGWHSGKLSCKELDVDSTLSFGNLNFGAVELDTLLINGRIASGVSAGGTSLALGSTYAYGEAVELRYNVTSWTGIGSSFKALYLRSEADLGGSYGLKCAEFYAVMDTSTTTGLSSLQNVYAEMLVKASASNRTLTNAHCVEANISIENQTGTLTLTNNIYCLYAKAQTGTGINDYTKVNGIKIAGRDDGTARVFGNALDICNPEATVCSWTKGINITTSCTTGINLDGTITTGIVMEPSAMTNGIIIGTPNTASGYGLKPNMADSYTVGAPVSFYFDDGGTAITAWGECFTVGLVVTANSTGAAQTGWPYTAFFYKDIQSNITSATDQHWATVMMSTSIATSKTVDGFDSHGLSTLHVSADVNGTLAAGTTLANLSFGGNSPGTISGKWVCMHVRDTTGNFNSFIKFDTNATGCYTTSYSGNSAFIPNSKGTFTQVGQIKIMIGDTDYYIPYGTVA